MTVSTELKKLMVNIKNGNTSRNKNYYPLLEVEALRQFKRAKLILSLIKDIHSTSKIKGNRIDLKHEKGTIEIQLFNPTLSYKRKTFVSQEEFELIIDQSDGLIAEKARLVLD